MRIGDKKYTKIQKPSAKEGKSQGRESLMIVLANIFQWVLRE
jgi:hypothetical protein